VAERAIEEAKRKKLGAQWMIVGEGRGSLCVRAEILRNVCQNG
jgi:hypothetical protein